MVLKFDLSSIPANTHIEKAELSLYTFDNFIGYQGRVLPNGPKTIHEITTPWEEAKVTWQYPPEFHETPIDTSHEEGINVWEHFDVTSYVHDLMSGQKENHGLLIKQVPTFDPRAVPSTGVQIYSSEYSVVEMRPRLTLYTDKGTAVVAKKVQSSIPKSGSFSVEILNLRGQILDRFDVKDIGQIESELSAKGVMNVQVVKIKNSRGEGLHSYLYNPI